jgi:hypothetical protein
VLKGAESERKNVMRMGATSPTLLNHGRCASKELSSRKKDVDLGCGDASENGSEREEACQVRKRRDIQQVYAMKEKSGGKGEQGESE